MIKIKRVYDKPSEEDVYEEFKGIFELGYSIYVTIASKKLKPFALTF